MTFFSQSPDVFDEDESQSEPIRDIPMPPMVAAAPPSVPPSTPPQSFDQFQEEMVTLSEVEVRLLKANYYRAVLDQPLFGDDDPIANEVQEEIRQYTLKRLRQLMGIEQEAPAASAKSDFTEVQLQTLRALADRMAGKLGALERPAPQPKPAEPQVKPVTMVRRQPTKPGKPRAKPEQQQEAAPTTPSPHGQVQPSGGVPKPAPFPNEQIQHQLAANAAAHREFSRSSKPSVVDIALQHMMK